MYFFLFFFLYFLMNSVQVAVKSHISLLKKNSSVSLNSVEILVNVVAPRDTMNILKHKCFMSCLSYFFSDWVAVTCHTEAVKHCPQWWVSSPLVWESWTLVTTTYRVQDWSSCLLQWRAHSVHWEFSGQDSVFSADDYLKPESHQ